VPTVVVDDVVIAAWVQVAILAVVVMGAFSGLCWARRRITRRPSRQDLRPVFLATAGAVEMVALAGRPDGGEPSAEQSSGESGLLR
jgi:hypothetical protein